MTFTPASILGMWLRGVLAVLILGAAGTLLWRWAEELPAPEPRQDETSRPEGPRRIATFRDRLAAWRPGWDRTTALLAGGVGLALLGLLGKSFATHRLFRRSDGDRPGEAPQGETIRVNRPDGTALFVEALGAASAPTLILTHGWGNDSRVFYQVKRRLASTYRLVLWDLPGHGKSSAAGNQHYGTARLADDLAAILEAVGGEKAILVGHSLGGMTVLSLCQQLPELVRERVSGIVLVHTTYTNPLKTMSWGSFYSALQKPLIEPLLHLTIWLSPLVRALNWLSYWNGSAHRSTARQSFAGTETREQLDFAARYTIEVSPAVLARGAFGMLKYDAQAVLGKLPAPACVVAAASDRVCRPEASQTIAQSDRSAELKTLDPARHLGFVERGEEFVRLLAELQTSLAPSHSTPSVGQRRSG